jgi:hypothetical protein
VSWAWALPAPLLVQTAAMGFDEFHFHRRRGLGAWERVGHPLDTLTVLACIAWALFTRPDVGNVACYVGLAICSCLFITKDEFVHARRCSPGEHWVHALLFVVHPLGLASVAILWRALHAEGGGPLPAWPFDSAAAARLLLVQFLVTAAFVVHQTIYWNFPWLRRPRASL